MGAELITRVYNNFRGVDFRGEEINLVRSPDALNMWKDYKEIESIRTRPELELVKECEDPVHGIYFYKNLDTERMMIHSGNKLHVGLNSTLSFDVEAKKSNAFIYNNVWYFLDGARYLQLEGNVFSDVYGYEPRTSIGRKPGGGGTIYEDVNLLSDFRTNSFVGDGESEEYCLDVPNFDSDGSVIVEVDGVRIDRDNYIPDYDTGKVLFTKGYIPPAPQTDGQDNVFITFKKAVPGNKEKILKCTMLQIFDNRVFVSGNPDYPNFIWHCSLNDPTYFSDLDYYVEGYDNAAIKGIVAGNNALWVFKEPSQEKTTVFYHNPTIDSEYGKIYPSTHSNIATGCVGKAINFNDDIVFFSDRGMEAIHGDITTEQAVAHRSTLVDRKMLSEADYKDMLLEEWEGYLLVFIGDSVYLADSRGTFTNENHIEYEWFYWKLGKKINCTCVHNGILYLGTDDGIYTLTDKTGSVESWWVTPKDKAKYPHKLKTTNKRGCVAEATGDVSVYAKTDKTDFELIGDYKNVTDYFVSRIKRKKFKDIQLKFHSKTRFSLETVSLEFFVGGYVKR